MQKEILTSNSGVIPDYSQAGQAKTLWSDLDQFLLGNSHLVTPYEYMMLHQNLI